MKAIFALLLLPGFLAAQDCKLKKTTDPYTRETRLSTGLMSLSGTSLSIEADSREIDFFFTVEGRERCFDETSTIVVNYEGKKVKGTFKNSGATNCDGFVHIIFRNAAGTNSLLQRLITQRIVSFQLIGTDKKPITVELSVDEQDRIMSQGDCLVKEAKTLLKS